MTNKSTFAVGAAMFVAGAGAVALFNRSGDSSPEPASAPPARSTSASPGSGFAPVDGNGKAIRSRARDEVKNPKLAEKYGESRTNLSKHVSTNIISLLEDAVAMGEMATTGPLGSAMGGRGGLRMALGRAGGGLKLNDEQQEKAATMYADFQKRELNKTKEAIERLKKDPTSLMQLMLASDALSRGEITDEEYKRLQTEAGEELQGVRSPLDERNFRGGRPLNDETFRSELETILDPEQLAALSATLDTEEPAEAESTPPDGAMANLPAMELEKLDSTIESVKKLTTGIKTMMDGMSGLQDLGPLLQQRGEGAQPE